VAIEYEFYLVDLERDAMVSRSRRAVPAGRREFRADKSMRISMTTAAAHGDRPRVPP
jgi:hypothetical protein